MFKNLSLVSLLGVALAAGVGTGPARAADLASPRVAEPAPQVRYSIEERVEERRIVRRPMLPRHVEAELEPEPCRVVVRRRIDADGEQLVRRLRVCDEGEVVVRRRDIGRETLRETWTEAGPDVGREVVRRAVPLPPRNVGPDLDVDDDEGEPG